MGRPINTTSNQDWMNAERSINLVPKLDTNEEEAELFVKLAGKFLLTQGNEAGKRLEDVWLPWQKDALKLSYQVRESFWVLGKGSGKSLTAGAFALAVTMINALRGTNSRGLVVCLAPTIPAAKIVFEHVQEAILADDELRGQFKSNVQDRSLTHKDSGIKIQVLACELKAAVGRRPIALIVDELHEIGKLNEGLAVTNQLRQGGRNFGDDFKALSISTMPTEHPKGEFKRVLDYATKVRDGVIEDNSFAPIIYSFPLKERPDLDPMNPAEWWRGMPSLRTPTQRGTMDAEELRRELETAAKAEDSESFTLLLSQRLGILRDLDGNNAQSVLHSNWNDAPQCSIDLPHCASLYVGIDVGGIDDPMAMVALNTAENGQVQLRSWQFLTQSGYDRAHASLQAVYDEAIAFGSLIIRQTTEEMDQALFAVVKRLISVQPWATLGGDEHGRAGFRQNFLDEFGVFKSVPQTWVLGAALSQLEGLMIDGKLAHTHCPLMRYNVQSLLIEDSPNGNRRIKKADNRASGQGHSKIDGIAATLSALHMIAESQEARFDPTSMVG